MSAVFFIVSGVFGLIILVCTAIYLSDRQGWNATIKRLSRITRASIEHARMGETPAKARRHKGAVEAWEAEFNGKPIESPAPSAMQMLTAESNIWWVPTGINHEITKLDYEKTHLGPWPRWTCKCGATQSKPVVHTLEAAQAAAKREAEEHVRTMNDNEAKQTDPRFKF